MGGKQDRFILLYPAPDLFPHKLCRLGIQSRGRLVQENKVRIMQDKNIVIRREEEKDRRAVEHLCQYRERNLFLRGIVPLLGFPTATVYYDRSPRTAGTSKYSLAKMVGLAVDGITSFSIRPVRMVMAMGLLFLLITFGILCYVLHAYIVGDTVPGWTSLMLSVWFVGACILIALGIVGEYVGKTYIEVKDRPRYHVEQTLGSNAVQRD